MLFWRNWRNGASGASGAIFVNFYSAESVDYRQIMFIIGRVFFSHRVMTSPPPPPPSRGGAVTLVI